MLAFNFNLTQAIVTLEEVTSIEKMPPTRLVYGDFFFFFFFGDSPNFPWTCYQTGLEIIDLLCSPSAGTKGMHHQAQLKCSTFS